MKHTRTKIMNTFAAGALAMLPLVATALILIWAVRFLYEYLGPGSWVGELMSRIGIGLVGSELLAYLIGVAIVIVFIFALGVLVRSGLAKVGESFVQAVVQKIPVVRNIYDVVKSLVDLFSQRDQDKLKSMSAVWLHFGGVGGSVALGLLSTRDAVMIGDIRYLAVLVPTAPVPVGGGLLYVPEDWVTPADVGMEGVTSIYVSMGVTSGQYLPTADASGGSKGATEKSR
jgi:uncharacterized membrane protein